MQDMAREKDSLTKLNAQLLHAQKDLNLRRENSLKEIRDVSSEKEAILKRFEELRGENKTLHEAFEVSHSLFPLFPFPFRRITKMPASLLIDAQEATAPDPSINGR